MNPAESIAQLERLVASLLSEAKQQGASAAEATVSTSTGLAVNVRMGEVETIEHTRDQGLSITVYFGRRKGSSSTTDLKPGAVREAVGKACTIAKNTSEDPCSGLAEAALMAKEIPDLDLHHPWPIDTAGAIELALEMEQAARERDPRISNSEGA
ncbi:MAG TPA: metalloprotease PmbA, partial [Rhizobiales bacterium]|nr:metalloprotease PmbA [Hyphomicrobiales bacterium]